MSNSSLDLLIIGTLFLIPFLSLIVGRLQSLCIDFVGSAVSLVVSFFDSANHFLSTVPRESLPKDYAADFFYVTMLTLFSASFCIYLYKIIERGQRNKPANSRILGIIWLEGLYWIAVVLSMLLLLFAFSINVSCQHVFSVQTTKEATLFAFVGGILGDRQDFYSIVGAMVVSLVACALCKYLPALRNEDLRMAYAEKGTK